MQFQKFLDRNGLTLPEVAASWGMHHTTLWRVTAGRMIASPEIMLRAVKLSNGQVTPFDWLETFSGSLSEECQTILKEYPHGQKARPKRPYVRRKGREAVSADAAA